MTEDEWLTCTDPKPMLEFLRGKASDRELRLFCCACCRHIWHLLSNHGRMAIEITERFCNGLAGEDELLALADPMGIAEKYPPYERSDPQARYWESLIECHNHAHSHYDPPGTGHREVTPGVYWPVQDGVFHASETAHCASYAAAYVLAGVEDTIANFEDEGAWVAQWEGGVDAALKAEERVAKARQCRLIREFFGNHILARKEPKR